MPNPSDYDDKNDFISDCIKDRRREHPEESQRQSIAVCESMWENKDMSDAKFFATNIEKGERDGQWVMGATAKDRVNDTIAPDAFTKAIKGVGGKLIALWQHKNDQPVGYWHNLVYKSGKLIGDLKLSDTNLGRMIKQLLSDGVPLGASIGFRGLDGDMNDDGGIHFKSIELLETSIVSVPANPLAVQIAKNFGIDIKSLDIDSDSAASGDTPGLPDEAIKKAKAAILRANQTLRKR